MKFAFVMALVILTGFDLIMLTSPFISAKLNWCCWYLVLCIYSMKILRSIIDFREEGANWALRTSNVAELLTAMISFLMLRSPLRGRVFGFFTSFVLADFIGFVTAVLEKVATLQNSRNPTPPTVLRLVWRDEVAECECTVCLERFYLGDTYLRLPCQHALHDNCGRAWFVKKRECPLCRVPC